MTVILVGHLPHEGHFRSERHRVTSYLYDDDFGKWEAIVPYWDGPETLVHLDNDIELTDAHIDELLACPHAACSWAYRLHWASCGIAEGVMAQRFKGQYVTEGDEWSDISGHGLIKLTRAARVAPLRKAIWSRVEGSIHESFAGPWHLHWPEVNHWHW